MVVARTASQENNRKTLMAVKNFGRTALFRQQHDGQRRADWWSPHTRDPSGAFSLTPKYSGTPSTLTRLSRHSNLEYIRTSRSFYNMAPRQRCPVCRSKQWHKEPSSGLIACSEGHILQVFPLPATFEVQGECELSEL